MKKEFNFTPRGVCSTNIHFELDGDKLTNVKFTSGCNGNLKAVAKLVEGRSAKDVAELLQGNDCNGRGTSCADQFSKAIAEALATV